jgi:anti-anti-sigma factor
MLSCDIRTTPGQTLLTVSGDIDLASSDQLWDALQPCILPGARVVIEGSGIAFIDSTGLGVLIRAVNRAEEVDAVLSLAAPSDPLRRLLELAGVGEMFAVVATEEAPA